jgi:hypothetical protein
MVAQLKIQPTNQGVLNFLNSVSHDKRREDSFKVLSLMQEVIGEEPIMWGSSIIGFGRYQYKYASGREGEWFVTGFAPRKQALTLYIMSGFSEYDELLGKLGKHSIGKACLYIKKLEDIDMEVLRELIEKSAENVSTTNT